MITPENILGSNGKPLQKSYRNAMNKAIDSGKLDLNGPDREVSNPYTGLKRKVSGVLAGLIEATLSMYADYGRGSRDFKVSVYDNLRYSILAIDANVYYDFID